MTIYHSTRICTGIVSYRSNVQKTEHSFVKMVYALANLLLLLNFCGNLLSLTTAHSTKREPAGLSCLGNIGDVTNCKCLGSPNSQDSEILSLHMPSFWDNFTDHSCEALYGYAWGFGDLASDVASLYQDADCTASDVAPSNSTQCASAIARSIMER